MKHILSFFLCAVLLLGLCACGAPGTEPAGEPFEPVAAEPEETDRPVGPEVPETGENVMTPGELMALTGLRESAEELAELYGITLVSWESGVAEFHTEEDPVDVISRGIENGWPELSLNGTGVIDDAPEREGSIFVSTGSELADAVNDGAVITLSSGILDLTDSFEIPNKKEWDHAYLNWVDDGWELVIHDVNGLTLEGAGTGLTELVCRPRYANVLRFENCSDLVLCNMTIGHTVEPGYCLGCVLLFQNCYDITMNKLDLYGCGTYGFYALDCYDVYMFDSVIRDCTYGILSSSDSRPMIIKDSVFKNCVGYSMLDCSGSDFSFTNCVFSHNEAEWDFMPGSNGNTAYFQNCTFGSVETKWIRSGLSGNGGIFFDESCVFDDGKPAPDISEPEAPKNKPVLMKEESFADTAWTVISVTGPDFEADYEQAAVVPVMYLYPDGTGCLEDCREADITEFSWAPSDSGYRIMLTDADGISIGWVEAYRLEKDELVLRMNLDGLLYALH